MQREEGFCQAWSVIEAGAQFLQVRPALAKQRIAQGLAQVGQPGPAILLEQIAPVDA
jgi:hypothetical protein